MLRRTIIGVSFAMVLICTGAVQIAHAANEAAVQMATGAAASWLRLVDEGNYRESWDQTSSYFKAQVPEQQWAQQIGATRQPLGKVISRKQKLARYATVLPGAPDGQYVVIQYDTSFENKKSAIETITPMFDKADGRWHVSGYFIR